MKTRRKAAGLASLSLTLVFLLSACDGSPSANPDRSPSVLGKRIEHKRPCESYTLIGRVRVPVSPALQHPRSGAPVLGRFPRVNVQGAQQVFPLLDETYAAGRVWYQALLPMRPNGATGWIRAADLRLQRSDYRLVVDLSRLRLDVFDLCKRIARYPIAVGTRDTPTPRGTFFLNSLLKPPDRNSVYGVLAFGLSAYSNVIRDWTWGGVVGIHGTNDPSSIGHRVSHGCIRLQNADIRALARRVPLGTLVQIH
jgi:L,D-transpeptidase catalytic domain